MKITVTAKPRSKKEYIKMIDDSHYVVAVNAPPVDDKANRAIREAIAEYFDKPISQVTIIRGEKSKQKIIEIF